MTNLNKRTSLLFLVCFLLYMSLSMVLRAAIDESDTNMLYFANAVFISIPSFLLPSLFFRRKNHFESFKMPPVSHMLLAVVLGIGCVFLNQSLSYLNASLLYGLDMESNATTALTIRGLNTWNMLFSLAIIPPICEEFLMRGTLLESWGRTSPIAAALLTSLLFGLLHAAPSMLIVYFGIGLLCAFIYIITRNVWITVTVHFINNLSSVLIAYALGDSLDALEEGQSVNEAMGALNSLIDVRLVYLFLFFMSALFAAAIIVPIVFALRSSCRKHGIGMFAKPSVQEYNTAKHSIFSDPILWLTIALLLILNIISGLYEFKVIKP